MLDISGLGKLVELAKNTSGYGMFKILDASCMPNNATDALSNVLFFINIYNILNLT